MSMPLGLKRKAYRVWGNAFAKALIVLEPHVEGRRIKDKHKALWNEFTTVGTKALRNMLRESGYPWDLNGRTIREFGRSTGRVLREFDLLPRGPRNSTG